MLLDKLGAEATRYQLWTCKLLTGLIFSASHTISNDDDLSSRGPLTSSISSNEFDMKQSQPFVTIMTAAGVSKYPPL